MESDFTLVVGDDPEFEDLTAEISYRGEFLCRLSQEEGFESLAIEIFPKQDKQPWHFKLKNFEDSISKAVERLWELRRTVQCNK
jgi:hypothetical protein